jgi:hypothetical protein
MDIYNVNIFGHHASTLGIKGQVIKLRHTLCTVHMQHEFLLMILIIYAGVNTMQHVLDSMALN